MYQDVSSRASLTSSNPAVATVITNVFPFGTSAASLTGVSGQVTLTASYWGLSSSLTFVASAAARPCPMITTSLSFYGIYEDVQTFTNIDLPDCRTVTSPPFSSVEWSSSESSRDFSLRDAPAHGWRGRHGHHAALHQSADGLSRDSTVASRASGDCPAVTAVSGDRNRLSRLSAAFAVLVLWFAEKYPRRNRRRLPSLSRRSQETFTW